MTGADPQPPDSEQHPLGLVQASSTTFASSSAGSSPFSESGPTVAILECLLPH